MSSGNDPACTIVVPVYNGERFLRECILSAAVASRNMVPIIIVNDGSTDGTEAVASALQTELTQVEVITLCNGGVSRARNAGLERVSSPYVCFLDADDKLREGSLDILCAELESNPSAVASWGDIAYIDEYSRPHPKFRGRISRSSHATLGLEDFLQSVHIDTPGAILFRTEHARRAGGFMAELAVAADWEFNVRVARLGTFLHCQATVIEYRLHSDSMTHTRDLDPANMEPVIRRIFDSDFGGAVRSADLQRYKMRSQANILRSIGHRADGISVSVAILRNFAKLLAASKFDFRVGKLFAQTFLTLSKRVLIGAA